MRSLKLPTVYDMQEEVAMLRRHIKAMEAQQVACQQVEAERTQRMMQLQGLAQVALEIQARLAVHDVLRITAERACELPVGSTSLTRCVSS